MDGVEGKLKVWIRRVWTLEMVCLLPLTFSFDLFSRLPFLPGAFRAIADKLPLYVLERNRPTIIQLPIWHLSHFAFIRLRLGKERMR